MESTVTTSRSRRILFGVTIDYQLRYHEGLTERLVSEGWEVHVVSTPGPNLENLNQRAGITSHPLMMTRRPNVLGDFLALVRWISVLRRIRPDVVLLGTPKAGLVGLAAACICRVPHRIYELHGLRLESAKGVRRIILTYLERITCSLASQIVPVSTSLAERAVEAGLLDARSLTILGKGSPNGVDVEHFQRAISDPTEIEHTRDTVGLNNELPVVLFLGRLTEDKGIECLTKAASRLLQSAPIQLLIVGPVDDPSGKLALTALRETGVTVVWSGEVDDVAPYLAVADVLCLPSRREGLPTVILEAFASGVPVVATRATGIVDLVRNGQTGYLVAIDDESALAIALHDAISRKRESTRMAAAALRLVKTDYSRREVQDRWIGYLKGLCTEDSGSGLSR